MHDGTLSVLFICSSMIVFPLDNCDVVWDLSKPEIYELPVSVGFCGHL